VKDLKFKEKDLRSDRQGRELLSPNTWSYLVNQSVHQHVLSQQEAAFSTDTASDVVVAVVVVVIVVVVGVDADDSVLQCRGDEMRLSTNL